MSPWMETAYFGTSKIFVKDFAYFYFSAVAFSCTGDDDPHHLNLRAIAADVWYQIDNQLPEGEEKERLRNLISGGLPDGTNMDDYGKSITEYAKKVTLKPGVYAGSGEAVALARHFNRRVLILVKEEENSVRLWGFSPDFAALEIDEPVVYNDSRIVDIFTRFRHNNEDPIVVWFDRLNHFHGIRKI